MIKQIFDISKRPKMVRDNVAYFVNYKNVHLHQQYVSKYYRAVELFWFNRQLLIPMMNDKNYTLILYYDHGTLSYDCYSETAKAYWNQCTIYDITDNALITVE